MLSLLSSLSLHEGCFLSTYLPCWTWLFSFGSKLYGDKIPCISHFPQVPKYPEMLLVLIPPYSFPEFFHMSAIMHEEKLSEDPLTSTPYIPFKDGLGN